MTWRDYWGRYLTKYSAVHHRPATTELLRHVGKHVEEFLGGRELSDTDDAALDDFTAWLHSTGHGPRTININLAALAKALRVALRWKIIGALPFTRVEFVKEPPLRIRYFDSKTRQRFAWAAKKYAEGVHEDMMLFYLCCGLRRCECLFLRWTHTNLEQGFVTIENTKTGESRQVPLPPLGVEILRRRVRVRRIGVPYVFFNPETGQPWNKYSLSHIAKKILRLAGLPDWHLHDLRHAFASHLSELGANTSDLMQILGDASPEMVRRYVHLTPTRVSGLMAAMDADLRATQQTTFDLRPLRNLRS